MIVSSKLQCKKTFCIIYFKNYESIFFAVNEVELCRVCPELKVSWKKQLNGKDEQHADAGSGNYPDNEIKETSEIKPFQE
jgi:hypothetical protein